MEESPALMEDLLSGLDSNIHEPVRLGILMFLHLHSSLAFSVLQKGLGVTSGNLNSHLTKLESIGFVTREKMFVNLRPRTVIHITTEGRRSLKEYTKSLKSILVGIEQGVGKESPLEVYSP
ncbi:MAG: transcriptional regulator [Candidatus Heimdallarchaeota archaeon]|nr:MAG: transcriptional regulator [Candidatus Heimdallarchaeota archaeon]